MNKKLLPIIFILILILILFGVIGLRNKQTKNDLYNEILDRNKLIVGISFDSKPFGFLDKTGKEKGFEVDLAKKIAEELLGNEDNIEFKNIETRNRIKAVDSGNVDIVLATMTITPERKKTVDFSKPYFTAGQAICVKKDSNINSIYDLMNKKIIVELETTGEKNIRKFVPNALIQGYLNNTDAINAFKNNNGDAITTDDALLQGFIMDNGNYIMLPLRLTKEPYGIVFKKSDKTKTLKEKINEILNDLTMNGYLQNIQNKWFNNEN